MVHSHTQGRDLRPLTPTLPVGLQVRSLADILPTIDVVENDGYNSSPTNVSEMGPDARIRFVPHTTPPARSLSGRLAIQPLRTSKGAGAKEPERSSAVGQRRWVGSRGRPWKCS